MKHLESIWEAYDRREELVERARQRRKEIEQAVLGLREEVEVRHVLPGSEYKRYVAVDSAYDLQIYGHATEYMAVAVAVLDTRDHRGRFFYDLPEVDTLVRVDLEEEFSRRILEGVGAALELILAARYVGDLPVIYLDGSFATFVIKLNSLLTFVKKHKDQSPFFRELWELGTQAVKDYHRIVRKGNAVACPKMSIRTEFYDYYGLDTRKELTAARNDYLLLDLLLEEGEYVKVPIQKHEYNLAFDKEEEVKEELFESINNAEVYYLKGLSGKVYKFEAAGKFDLEAVYPLTLGKELLPIMEADRLAKDYLNGFLREEYPEVLENYREG